MKIKNRNWGVTIGATISLLLIAYCIFYIIKYYSANDILLHTPQNSILDENLKSKKLSPNEIGDSIGGILSPIIGLVASLLTFLAFYMQKIANDDIQVQFKIQQFESQFYEMLRLHKENVDEISIIGVTGKKVSKRQAFVLMADEFKTFLSYLNFGNEPFLKEYEIAYDIFFWGWNNNYTDINTLSNSWITIKSGPSESDANYDTPIDFRNYKGYSSSLAHYFRHLFMMLKFVVYSSEIKNYKDKMKYLKILRAQLSNHEQIMLFYNWLASEYGGTWEDEQNHFFTDYKMIHNLWVDELYQNQYIIDAVNGLIDKYNQNPKGSPLFEFQRNNFKATAKDIDNSSLLNME